MVRQKEDLMRRTVLALTLVAPLALCAAACAATVTVEGYHAEYVDRPVIEGHRRWMHHSVMVYEVNGRFYREYGGRWIVYRERPRELVEVVVR
jgi:hypothetical protein